MPEAMEGPIPYTVRTLFNEETTVEREIIEHLRAGKLGWTWRSRDYLKTYRPDEREVLLLPLLREKLKALNPAGSMPSSPSCVAAATTSNGLPG
jgi:type I restriction enzyme R subunit